MLKKKHELLLFKKEQWLPKYRQRLLNDTLELKGNNRVFVRVRPVIDQDSKAYEQCGGSFESI